MNQEMEDRHALRHILYHANSVFLFIKSDVKSVVIPITISAILAARAPSATRVARVILWISIHLLQFCVSNQILSPLEDSRNKPWRPIPSGRVSIRKAQLCRWWLVPFCFLMSLSLGAFVPSLLLSVAIVLHNELGLDSHWLSRNLLNAAAYTLFDLGATIIACHGVNAIPPPPMNQLFIMNSLIIFTTIHAQDFRDEEGDRLQGRRTLPIVSPSLSRTSMLVTLLLWSLSLAVFVTRSVPTAALVLCLGLRFYFIRSETADRTSYTLYNIWLMV
ncbi:hypothetical protein HGRIS_005478 [Hohenbuehelia grisea]|uniref:Uncharacterized protein n=1 Tax=Hohenbuehelia grisea TaxID=104357 RepID=A0ABR3JYD5_9AGAR